MRTRAAKKHHKLLPIVFLAAILIVYWGFSYFSTDKSPTLHYSKSLTQPEANPIWPDYGSGAVGMIGSNEILTKHGDQSSRPIASITKVITALLVLDKKPINNNGQGQSIIFTENDQKIYNEQLSNGAAVKPIIVEEAITERQALEVMLLASAANYSKTLAIWAYGSMDAYLTAANDWLNSHNLNQTQVVDTSGLLSENVSSPSDLVKLGKLALKNKTIASIVATKQATISGVGTINNGNGLLGKNGVNGIKNGWISDAGGCLLFSSLIKVGNQNVTIVGSLLGASDSAQVADDVLNLITSMQPGFRSVRLVSKDIAYGTYKTSSGKTAKLKAKNNLYSVVWSDTPVTVKVVVGNINSLNSDGQGVITIKVGGKTFSKPLRLVNI